MSKDVYGPDFIRKILPKKDGTKSLCHGLSNTRGGTFAPPNGDVRGTVELFQTKFRTPTGYDRDEDEDNPAATAPACILPSGWGQRLTRPGPVYIYSKMEILEYNEMVYLHGAAYAKAWADRRWYERNNG